MSDRYIPGRERKSCCVLLLLLLSLGYTIPLIWICSIFKKTRNKSIPRCFVYIPLRILGLMIAGIHRLVFLFRRDRWETQRVYFFISPELFVDVSCP
jgi:hypothetical protein